jgi:hypothetical protein
MHHPRTLTALHLLRAEPGTPGGGHSLKGNCAGSDHQGALVSKWAVG